MNTTDSRFVQRARGLYRAAARQVDPDTSARLRAARIHALAASRDGGLHAGARWLVPGGTFAAIALAAVLVWQPLAHLPLAPSHGVAGNGASNGDADLDLPPDADQADPALYQNLDFYGWLAANDRPGGNQ